MADLPAPSDIDFWKTQLGLLPVPLRADHKRHEYLMLDGGPGNFCLGLEPHRYDAKLAQSIAWSSDVGHFVSSRGGFVEVFRWGSSLSHSEVFSAKDVQTRPDEFHEFLERGAPPRSQSVVQHAMAVFEGLWASMQVESGDDAIRAFMVLLASAHDNTDVVRLDRAQWGLSEESLQIAARMDPEAWIVQQRNLTEPALGSGLTPQLDLLLRHASGQLFQQAHRSAVMSAQMSLPGVAPARLRQIRDPRGHSGVFFTPPALARALVEVSLASIDLNKPEITIFDPACGSAEFLRESFRLLRIRGYRGRLRLIGWDISPTAVELSRFVLHRELVGASDPAVSENLEVKNSLVSEWPRGVDLVLMNPPFVSWDLMSADQRESVADVLGDLHFKKPNLASPFLLLAEQALADDGVVAAVVPSSVMSADSSRPLRAQLSRGLRPVLLAKLGSQLVFRNAIVDAGLYVATKERRSESVLALWADHKPSSISTALRSFRRVLERDATFSRIDQPSFSIYPAPHLGTDSNDWSPVPYQSYAMLSRVSYLPTVAELFDVKQGVRMGHDAFVIDNDFFKRLSRREQRFFRPAVMNHSIRGGRLSRGSFIFYPNTTGLPELASDRDLAKEVPTFYRERLKPNKNALVDRARISEDNWWHLMEHRAWLRDPSPKIVSTYFGDAGSFAFDRSGRFVPVVGNGWLPLRKAFGAGPSDDVWLAYLSILCSHQFSLLAEGVSKHVGGGQLDLSKRYIGRVRMPNLSTRGFDRSLLKGLAEVGRAIDGGSDFDQETLEQLTQAAYGLV